MSGYGWIGFGVGLARDISGLSCARIRVAWVGLRLDLARVASGSVWLGFGLGRLRFRSGSVWVCVGLDRVRI